MLAVTMLTQTVKYDLINRELFLSRNIEPIVRSDELKAHVTFDIIGNNPTIIFKGVWN